MLLYKFYHEWRMYLKWSKDGDLVKSSPISLIHPYSFTLPFLTLFHSFFNSFKTSVYLSHLLTRKLWNNLTLLFGIWTSNLFFLFVYYNFYWRWHLKKKEKLTFTWPSSPSKRSVMMVGFISFPLYPFLFSHTSL